MTAATATPPATTHPVAAEVAKAVDDDAMGEADAVYQELLTFLSSSRTDLRKAASSATLAVLTSASEGDANSAARRLTSLNVVKPLCRIASMASNDAGSADALASLSVLCAHDLVGNQCILDFVEECGGVGRMLEIALSSPPRTSSISGGGGGADATTEWNEWRERVNYACALLANATRTERGAVEFIGLSFPEEAVPSSVMTKEGGGSGEEKVDGDGAEGYRERDTTKPTATLLLSRFLNESYIDTSSEGYKSAAEAWNNASQAVSGSDEQSSTNHDEDDDLDYDALERFCSSSDGEEGNEKSLKEQQQKLLEPTKDDGYYDPYQHVASVIMNLSQLETGRKFLMRLIHANSKKEEEAGDGSGKTKLESIREDDGGDDNETKTSEKKDKKAEAATSHVQSILPQLNSPNVHRRRGVAGTLKNCCFSQDSVWWLLNVVHVDKALLMPLAGPEELAVDEKVGLDPDYWLLGPKKVREPDDLVRLHVVEAILLLLASGHRSRDTLRERRTYVIVKLADMVEENEEISERLLECVQYLRRDEEGTEEGSSDRRAYEKYARGMMAEDGAKNRNLKALPMSSTAQLDGKQTGADDDDDYDNID